MNKFLAVLTVIALLSTSYVLHEVNQVLTTVSPYSAENVERVRQAAMEDYAPPAEIVPDESYVHIPASELKCMQENIYFESRNQSKRGMISTAWVTINRVRRSEWGDTICAVVKDAKLDSRGNPKRHQCQFSWYCDGLRDVPNLSNKLEREAWEKSGRIAETMIMSCLMEYDTDNCPPDPTHGSVFYHSDKVKPEWGYAKTVKIDNHQYYKLDTE